MNKDISIAASGTKRKHNYMPCDERDVPSNVRFDCPARCQGQIVLVEYGGFGSSCMDVGDPYKRVKDQSEGWAAWRYFKLVP